MLGAASPPSSLSLAVHTLPFRALATLAARAPQGGEREMVMACFMTARLLSAALGSEAPCTAARAERAQAARGWFAALTLPKATRAVFEAAVDASATDDRREMAQTLGMVIEATAHVLDPQARREIEHLGTRLMGDRRESGTAAPESRPRT